ncbi:M23 family metallopeptidase [Thalassobacillus pellis]|uniref:M23 family metallopeptidase n=1 Tax=Thalassobacillus pellis TaxID=748008 RepID=UPI001961F00E|nr:M23 family metallopeptidase [Thalassobacillus pellis]MBM7554888.1 murein DD-endopeptidase MepM/ murein hydrolase activator NlpD [Thalassobacillus pellis]
MKKVPLFIFMLAFFFGLMPVITISAQEKQSDDYKLRMELYKKTAAPSLIPWYFLAAVDQFERQIHKEIPEGRVTAVRPEQYFWNGLGNPNQSDQQTPGIAAMFNGWASDGNGDGIADRNNDEDVLATIAAYIASYGHTKSDFKIALWNYYHRDLTVQTIINNAKVFKHFGTIELKDRDFPVPLGANYSYRSTWGDARGFGGRRIHEGTDIFANYGVPVKSTTYGVVEIKGWNKFGGWRIGIRDIFNIYHYYAHLNGFEDGVKVGDVVKPGDVIGSVGASGYGPPGTSGKFPPHLHYGMYKDNGYSEWSFDPHPYLRKWERMARN